MAKKTLGEVIVGEHFTLDGVEFVKLDERCMGWVEKEGGETDSGGDRVREAKYHTMAELLALFPNNPTILNMVIKTEDHIFREETSGGKIMVSVSGGSDSDIMIVLFEKLGHRDGTVVYVWLDTGLEYDATKRHLKFLEEKYGIEIKRYRPNMTVAQVVKKYGVPFLSKIDAQNIGLLQKHGFQFDSDDFEFLLQKYPNAKSALKYWCSKNGLGDGKNKYEQKRAFGLHEFMLSVSPPRISDKCCDFAKKKTAKRAEGEIKPTLNVIGVRRAESGIRSVAYTSCFSEATDKKIAQFRPMFYLTDEDKRQYKEFCGVTYSDCYEKWGFKRTGCVCCPFGSDFVEKLEVVKKYEPKLYATACKIFGPSYEYTRAYRKFKESLKREKRRGGQIDFFDDPYEILKEETNDQKRNS